MITKENKKVDGIKKPLKLHKQFLQKNSNDSYFPIGSSCQPCLVQAYFLLVAWNGSMLLFWSRSGKLTRSLFSFPVNGREFLLLFWLVFLYYPSPSYLNKLFQVQLPFSLSLFRTNISESNFFSLFSLDKNFLSPTSLPQKNSTTIPNSV